MLNNLEQIDKENRVLQTKLNADLHKYEVEGHWRHYKNGNIVWVESQIRARHHSTKIVK